MRGVRVGLPRALACVFAVVWLLSLGAPVMAAETPVVVSVAPAQIALAPGRSAVVLVSLANTTDKRVPVTVTAVAAEDSVITSPVAPFELAPGQSRTEAVTVTRRSEGSGQDVGLSFVVDSRAASAVAGTTVKAVPNPPPVTVTAEAGPDRVNENRPGSATLVIGTDREGPVRVTALSVTPPPHTWLEVTCPGGRVARWDENPATGQPCEFDLAPRSKVSLPVRVGTEGAVVPGTRPAVFRVSAQEPGRAETAVSLVVTMPVTLEVFGESDILQALGVPVFLVLPGVIIVLTAGFLVRRCSPWRRRPAVDEEQAGSVVAAATRTAVLGVLLSLGMAKLYPVLTAWFWPGEPRDYTREHAFLDFYLVFGYSFAVATAIWLLVLLGDLPRALWAATHVPHPGDAPVVLLRKLSLRRSTSFPLVEVDDLTGVLVRRTRGEGYLVAPRVVVTTPAGSALRTRVETLVSRNRPVRLYCALRWAVFRGRAELGYRSSDIDEVLLAPEVTIRNLEVGIAQIGE
ncbi:hypothetical protein [Actinokineospora cianjurensis]|uniref:hypothetical protein n=1 Tax=Actinokineospora cianjurensis TaxID=585224 RepID=UPI0011C3ED93|nr:hypothetical protein [Actinokineospora cianjurensis]